MADYFELDTSIYVDYGIDKSPDLPVHISFLSGQPITESLPPMSFETDFPADVSLPHFWGDVIPLVSQTFIQLLQQAGIDNFQTFPAVVRNPDTGQCWNEFFAFNIIGVVAAVDSERSQGDRLIGEGEDGSPPRLMAFKELKIDTEKVIEPLMFRLAESPDVVVIKSQVADLLKHNRPDGDWQINLTPLD